MRIHTLTLSNFRNYEALNLSFHKGTNLLYGNNAQGKTNILEAIFLSCTTKSHKGAKDTDMIRFTIPEAHIRNICERDGKTFRVDMHLRRQKAKGIALDGVRMKRASEFLNKLCANVVLFSPEDLGIIKSGPSARRRFLDLELCQLKKDYAYELSAYHHALKERTKLLKKAAEDFGAQNAALIDLYDEQLIKHGSYLIREREAFLSELMHEADDIHRELTGNKEFLKLNYEPDVTVTRFEEKLLQNRKRDLFTGVTHTGPHRDDFAFYVRGENTKENDLRFFGSQGQQRSAALSLKLSEIGLIRRLSNQTPLLLLDDVLSELDGTRQQALLQTIGPVQTIITCTGLDEFVENNFAIDRLFLIENGTAKIQEQDGIQ